MGICCSCSKKSHPNNDSDSIERPSTIRIIHVDGYVVEEYTESMKAKKILSQNPNFFLCNFELLVIGESAPHVGEEEDLEIGQIYLLISISEASKLLSFSDIAYIAVRANEALLKANAYHDID